jgi:hypothetical protein
MRLAGRTLLAETPQNSCLRTGRPTSLTKSCLRKFLRFEFPIEILRKVLAPLVTFTLEGPGTLHAVKYAARIPKNPVMVTRADINSAIEKARTGEITQHQVQQWASMLLLNDAFDWSGEDEGAIADMLADLSS